MGRRRRDARRCVVLEGPVLAVLIRLTWCCGDILLKTFLFLFLRVCRSVSLPLRRCIRGAICRMDVIFVKS